MLTQAPPGETPLGKQISHETNARAQPPSPLLKGGFGAAVLRWLVVSREVWQVKQKYKEEKNMHQEHIEQIFACADIQHIRELLTADVGLDAPPDNRSYADRLKSSSANMVSRLRKLSKDEQDFSDMYDDFMEATVEYTNVFLEVGMKVGARLTAQLLMKD